MIRAIALAFMISPAPAMADRCGLVVSGGLIVLRNFNGGCPPDPSGKPEFKWLLAPITTIPNYYPATQILTGPFYSVGETEVSESYTVTDKTAQQLDDDKTAAIDGIPQPILLALCYLNNAVGPDLTEAQCKTLFKGLLP